MALQEHVKAPQIYPTGDSPAACSAIIPAYRRIDQALATLQKIQCCKPAPAEIIVHVDGNQTACAEAVKKAFPAIRVLISEAHIGPGGARNNLVASATYPIVASFDDDSYPLDSDYFGRLLHVFKSAPDASVIAAAVYHRDEIIESPKPRAQWSADFVGCGCAYRRQDFLRVGGYVPLPIAYGMEEADLALRLHAVDGRVLETPWLRVFHDTDRKEQSSAAITSASVANVALLAFLRYPIPLFPVGACQVANRILWLLMHKRYKGILQGLMDIPAHLAANVKHRRPESLATIRSYRQLRRAPQEQPLNFDSSVSRVLARNL